MGSYVFRMGFRIITVFLWVPIGFLRPPLLVCPVVRCHCCPVLVSYYIFAYFREPLGFLMDPLEVDDDDDNDDVVAADVAAAVSDDDDDNGHGDDHHHHPPVIHIK